MECVDFENTNKWPRQLEVEKRRNMFRDLTREWIALTSRITKMPENK